MESDDCIRNKLLKEQTAPDVILLALIKAIIGTKQSMKNIKKWFRRVDISEENHPKL